MSTQDSKQTTADKPSRPMTRQRMMLKLGLYSLGLGVLLLLIGWLLPQRTVLQLGLLCAGLGLIWLVCARFTSSDPVRKADTRYLREFFPAMIAYVLVLVLVWPLSKQVTSPVLDVLIALLPAVPVLFVARAMVRRILAGDELERRMHLEASAIAALVVGLLSMSTAFLQAAGLVELKGALMWVFPAMMAVWGLALWWAKRRYRAE